MKGRRAFAAVVTVMLSGCGGGSGQPTSTPTSPSTPSVGSLVVSGWSQPLTIGERVQLSATAIYTDGSNRMVTTDATWESSNPDVATVTAGSVVGVGEGAAAIIARFGGKDGNLGVTVQRSSPTPTPNPTPTPSPNPPGPPPTPPPGNPGLACGTERWFVKTLADQDATKVNPTLVTPITIRDLNGFATHCSGLPDRRTFAEEFKVFEATGRITFVAHEDDRDYHLAVEDPAAPGFTIVTELADTACQGAVLSPHLTTLMGAQNMFAMILANRSPSALVGTTVRLKGVGFYDFDHGQRGRSRNCIELHPILSIERLQ